MSVYWITGLAGAGKTTIAQEVAALIRGTNRCVVILDGDDLRSAMDMTDAHEPGERIKLAMGYSKLAKLVAEQGIDVVMATMSLFPEVWSWNRDNIPSYREIYLKVPLDVLVARDKRGLYSGSIEGKARHVVGMNCTFNEPDNPDLMVVNDGIETPSVVARRIFSFFQNY